MRIYHHGAYKTVDVPSGTPVESTEDDAKSVFARLADEGSFLGILLGGGRTLQFCRQADGTLHAEVLKEAERVIRYCIVSVPLAELLVEAAFRGEDLEQKIAFSRVAWNDDKLTTA